MKKWGGRLLILALIAGVSVGAGFAWGWRNDKAVRNAALKKAEASAAEAKDLKAAKEVGDNALRDAIAEVASFNKEVALLVEELESIGAGSTEVREITRWRTETIEVPVDVLVDRIVEVEVPVPGDCPVLPDFSFEVEGREARIETELGNTFATGIVELWRTAPPPRTFLGDAPWRSELTEILTPKDVEQKPDLRRMLMIGKVLDSDGYTVKYSHRFSRRFGVYGGVLSGSESCVSGYDYDNDESQTVCTDGAKVEAGLSFAF